MTKKTTTDNTIQTELFPSEKSERAFDWRVMVMDHAITQDRLYKGFYKLLGNKLKSALEGDTELSIAEIKQGFDGLRNAGSWTKQISEALQISEEALNNAIIANSGNNLNFSGMSNEEIDNLLREWI